MTDRQLVAAAQSGDPSALEEIVRRHGERARRIGLAFHMPDGERADVEQEALVGLLRAVRTFRPDGGREFGSFVRMCVWRYLVSVCVLRPQRGAAKLTEAVRVGYDEDGDEWPVVDLLPAPGNDVPSLVEGREEVARLMRGLSRCSQLEAISLVGLTCGLSYREIEERHGYAYKTADNAVQRARTKLREAA